MVTDGAARVYRVPAGRGPLGKLYDYSGCFAGRTEPQLLARRARAYPRVRVYGCAGYGCRLVREIRLVGATVGIVVEHHGLDDIETTLTVRDLAARHVLHTVEADMVVGYGDSLIEYVLAPSGNIAWSIVTASSGPRGTFRYGGTIRSAIGQTVTTLDAGPSVRAKSLRLRGATVQWIDGGTRRTAPLP